MKNKTNKVLFVILSIFIFLFGQSIVYGAFSSTFNVTGRSFTRVETDVRVTDFYVKEVVNANSQYAEFGKDSLSSSLELTAGSGRVTYTVEVTNYGNDVGIYDITGLPNTHSYSLSNYTLKDKLCDESDKCNNFSVSTFDITINANASGAFILKLEFRPIYSVTYSGFSGNGYKNSVMEKDVLEVNFGANAPSNVLVTVGGNDYSNYSYVNGILKVNDVNGNVEISAVNGIGISGSLKPITSGQTTATVNITIDNASSSNYPITLKFYFKKASESDSSYRLAGTRTLNNSNSISYTYSSFSEYASYILRVVATDVSGTDASIEFTAGISCFLKGTKVIGENGPINIENVKAGDYIYALNLDNNERELRRVNSVYEGHTEETYEITVGDELIITTPKHQFYVVDKGWIRAFDLQEGDVLNSISDGNMVIEKIEHKFHDVPLPVYNMSVEGLHNYLVTEYQLLVHNSTSPWPK